MRFIPLLLIVACHGDDLYSPCRSAEDCDDVPDQDPVCVDKGGDGFCTWSCATNDDCNADERYEGFVCAPFESDGQNYCFPSCGGEVDEDEVCGRYLSCRSTGGGSENEQVCFPNEG